MSLFIISLILGLIQGLGEFLPISSSGHLILAQSFFGLTGSETAFNVVLHLGTLVAVVIFYRQSILSLLYEMRFIPEALTKPARFKQLYQERPYFRFGLLILAGSIPTGTMGIIFQKLITGQLSTAFSVGIALIITGTILRLVGGRGHTGRGIQEITLKDALIIGLVQGLAIVPGFSRSGFTICAGLFLGLNRDTAARYSFILSLPAIMGAALLEIGHLQSSAFKTGDFMAGFLVAAVSGYLALKFLVNILKRDNFGVFSWWCWAVGFIAISWYVWP